MENINPILLDRLINIKIDGFKIEDKLEISKNYLIPESIEKLGFNKEDIQIDDEEIKYIIENFTDEQGVRSLKKHLDSIYSKINVFIITDNKEILPYDLGDFNIPYKIEKKTIDILLKNDKSDDDVSLQHMYM